VNRNAGGNQTIDSLNCLTATKRVILSGTPIQVASPATPPPFSLSPSLSLSPPFSLSHTHSLTLLPSLPLSLAVQNDLEEYWAMVSFVRPGILGTLKQFRKMFSEPINQVNPKP